MIINNNYYYFIIIVWVTAGALFALWSAITLQLQTSRKKSVKIDYSERK